MSSRLGNLDADFEYYIKKDFIGTAFNRAFPQRCEFINYSVHMPTMIGRPKSCHQRIRVTPLHLVAFAVVAYSTAR